MNQQYQVQAFARLAGVSVRTLHHYDRMGLLKARRTRAGYRVYQLRDLARLEQVVALRFLGLSLKQIGVLLDRDLPLADTLRMQRLVLEEKRKLLDRAIAVLRQAEERPDAAMLKKIIEVIAMQNNTEWMKKYSTESAWSKIQERGARWTPELQERVSREWTQLFQDVEKALGEDPAGARAQALAARWQALLEEFTGRDPEIAQSARNLYADSANWPAPFQQQMAPYRNPAVWEFMHRALAYRKT